MSSGFSDLLFELKEICPISLGLSFPLYKRSEFIRVKIPFYLEAMLREQSLCLICPTVGMLTVM